MPTGDFVAYVGEPFVHDLFVSYSHGDVDGSGTSRLQRWSQGFARELESELKAQPPEFSRAVRIFLDQSHRPSQGVDPLEPLTTQLRADIEGSAMLIVLMSPQYLASEWCTREREWWCERQQKTGVDDGRIAVLRIWPTADAWPSNLTDSASEPLPGFWFYDRELPAHQQRPFGWPEPAVTHEVFQRALVNLVGHVCLKLEEVRKRLNQEKEVQAHAARLAASGGQVVYLHGRAESTPAWEAAATTLTDNGLVVPNDPDPVVSDPKGIQEIRRHRVEIMSGCDAVLLMADPDTRATDADLVVIGKHDRNSARAISNRPLPCALLNGVGAEISTTRRRTTARSLNVGWIDVMPPPPTWVQQLQAWLHDASQQDGGQ
jgi:hypothetical protein